MSVTNLLPHKRQCVTVTVTHTQLESNVVCIRGSDSLPPLCGGKFCEHECAQRLNASNIMPEQQTSVDASVEGDNLARPMQTAMDVAQCQSEGSRYFKMGDFGSACEWYTRALDAAAAAESDSSVVTAVLCNRSSALLKAGRYDAAVDDAAARGFVLHSKEHYVNFRIFERAFGEGESLIAVRSTSE